MTINRLHTEVSELHGFSEKILDKVPTFELLLPVKIYTKKCTKLMLQINLLINLDFKSK